MDPQQTEPTASAQPAEPQAFLPGATPTEQPVEADQAQPAESAAPEDELSADEVNDASDQPLSGNFSWQASEYLHHNKGFVWYFLLILVVAALIGVAVWTKQWFSIAVLVAMTVAVVVYARRPPRTLLYELDDDAITIDGKSYPFSHFRSFAVLPDIAWHAIDLEPTQRFMPRLTLLFQNEDFDAIVGHLSAHLPRADREPDLIERATRFLHF